jgi:hypothetical protein
MSGTVPGFQTSLPNRGVGMPATYGYGDLGGNRDSD